MKYVESFDLIDKSQTTALSTINVYSFIDADSSETLYLTDEVSKKDIGNLIDKIPPDAGVNPLIIKPIIEGWFDDYVKNICPKVPNQAKPKSDLLICWILPSAKSSMRFPGL